MLLYPGMSGKVSPPSIGFLFLVLGCRPSLELKSQLPCKDRTNCPPKVLSVEHSRLFEAE